MRPTTRMNTHPGGAAESGIGCRDARLDIMTRLLCYSDARRFVSIPTDVVSVEFARILT